MRTTQLLLNELPYRGDLFLPERLHARGIGGVAVG